MHFLKTIFILLLITCTIAVIAQPKTNESTHSGCAIEQATKAMYKAHPGLKEKMKTQVEALTNQPQLKSDMMGDLVPIVFHIIPTPCGEEVAFTKAELESILADVNTDFAGQNTSEYNANIDPTFYNIRAGDVGLKFRLAEIDPYGNPTDGITRPTTSIFSRDGLNFQTPLKEIIQWNPARYLNVWIVQDLAGASGVAQYPITAANLPEVDGIVMDHDYMRTNNSTGRDNILTHEIGHWLGLLHTWGDFYYPDSCPPNAPTYCDCDDLVNDTPVNLGYINTICPSTTVNTCGSGANDLPDNIHNFMDYGCEVMFTQDQKTRMWNVINNNIANRNDAVTTDDDASVFMNNNAQNSFAKLYLDKVVFRESDSNPGTVTETGIIELRDCNGCSFSNNINNEFTTTGLPPYITAAITKIGTQQAQISFNVNATNPYVHESDIENISISLNQNAIIGTSQVFNNSTIGGLKIDFRKEGLAFTNQVGAIFANDDFTAINIPYLGIEVGFSNQFVDDASIRMYALGTLEAAVIGNSIYLQRLGDNESISNASFRQVTGGAPNDPDNLILYQPGVYTEWLNQTGYVGVKVTTCSETYYMWIRIEVTANNVNILDAVINLDNNAPLNTGQYPVDYCTPSLTTNSNGMHLTNVTLEQIDNDSGNGAYESFVGNSTNLSNSTAYTLTLAKPSNNWEMYWRAWIDYNQDFDFDDPGEEILTTTTATNTVSQTFTVPASATAGATRMRVAMSYYYAPDPGTTPPPDPCGDNISLGEIEDYTVIIGGAACNVGEACNDNNVCTTNDVLDSNCNCVGTFQDSDNDGVCDANDECPNDPNNNCNEQTYCSSAGSMTNYEFIQNVNVASINNTSGNNGGYGDFTTQTANVNAGSSYVIILTPGFGTPTVYNEYWKVWIDFNKDGDFEDSGEELLSESSSSTINSTISIPASVPSGSTRMRVTMNYSNSVTPCGGFQYGEVEDYTVNIGGGGGCNVGTACDDNDVCTVDDVYDANCNCSGTFADADGDNICDFNDECPNDPNNNCNTCTVGAACNDNDACTSNDIYDVNCNCSGTFADADGDNICDANDECPNDANNNCNEGTYCSSASDNTNYEFIENVNTAGINNTSGDDGGYGDFTAQTANVNAGTSYVIILTPGFGTPTIYNEYWKVWIDFNKDGDFEDAGEELLSESGSSTINSTISIPASAPSGSTRMRITMNYDNPVTPCGTFQYGEVEDYTVNITGESPCNAPVPTASQITNDGSVYCNYAYGYCQGHPDNNKEFELTNLATGNTSSFTSDSHYATFADVVQNTNYQYRVRLECGSSGTYGGWSPYQNFTTPSCKLETEILNLNNYPNPFSDRTTIEFSLPNDSFVTLQVYDLTGRRVATPLDNEQKIAGNHRVIFNGKAHPSGMYMYTIQAGEYTGTGKMNLIK